jgi:hypothetical protein
MDGRPFSFLNNQFAQSVPHSAYWNMCPLKEFLPCYVIMLQQQADSVVSLDNPVYGGSQRVRHVHVHGLRGAVTTRTLISTSLKRPLQGIATAAVEIVRCHVEVLVDRVRVNERRLVGEFAHCFNQAFGLTLAPLLFEMNNRRDALDSEDEHEQKFGKGVRRASGAPKLTKEQRKDTSNS